MTNLFASHVALAAALAGFLALAPPPGSARQEEKKQEEKKREEKKDETKKEEVSKNPLDLARRPFMEERKREVDIRSEFKKMKDGTRFVYASMSGIQVTVTVKNGRVTEWDSRYRGRRLPIGYEKTTEDVCWVITPDNMRNEDVWMRVPCETIEGKLVKPPA